MLLQVELDDHTGECLEKLLSRRRTTRSSYVRNLIKGAIMAEQAQKQQHIEPGELRIVKHFQSVDLYEDLQFLGTKDAQLTKRQLHAAILVYADCEGKLPDEVHMFKMKQGSTTAQGSTTGQGSTTASHHGNEWEFSAVSLNILDYCLCHLLPKRLRDRLCEWSVAKTGRADNTATVLLSYLSKLYEAPKSDRIADEVNEEFEELNNNLSKEEAFNRTLK